MSMVVMDGDVGGGEVGGGGRRRRCDGFSLLSFLSLGFDSGGNEDEKPMG